MNPPDIKKRSSKNKHIFTVSSESEGLRLDQAIAAHIESISRQKAKQLIQIGAVWINSKRTQIISKKVKNRSIVSVYISKNSCNKSYESNRSNIISHDSQFLIYRKEPGIPTQGTPYDNYNNIYAALIRFLKNESLLPYLGLHHRLDAATSGVLLFTRSKEVNRDISDQFKNHDIKKTYLALVEGNPDFDKTEIISYISKGRGKYISLRNGSGKLSKTRFTKLADFTGYSLVRAEPETGRTHQIRIHLSELGHPVLYDSLYGNKKKHGTERTMLHSESITLFHPLLKKDIVVKADVFDDMKSLLKGYTFEY